MRIPPDYDRERLFEGVDALRRRGFCLDDILLEVGHSWVEGHKEAFHDAQEDARRRIFAPILGG